MGDLIHERKPDMASSSVPSASATVRRVSQKETVEDRVRIAKEAIKRVRSDKRNTRISDVDRAWGCLGLLDYVLTGNVALVKAVELRKVLETIKKGG